MSDMYERMQKRASARATGNRDVIELVQPVSLRGVQIGGVELRDRDGNGVLALGVKETAVLAAELQRQARLMSKGMDAAQRIDDRRVRFQAATREVSHD